MMMRLCAAVAASLLAALPAFAAGKASVRKKQPAEADSREPDADTSAARRAHKTAAVFGEVGFTFTPMSGLHGEYFLDPNNLITASFLQASGVGVILYSYDKTLVDVRYKHFFTNTFYMDGGLGLETFQVRYDVLQSGSSLTYKTLSGKATNLGAEIHIGNQWQWSGFSLGCDWVGYFLALSKSFSAGSADGLDAADKADRERTVTSNLNAGNAQVVRFYVGWAF